MARGTHGRSGRPRDPNALRRERDKPGDWLDLPRAGREGPPPDWPLSKPTARELTLWAREWARPQAIVWEALGLITEVAVFVRTLRQAESPKSSVAMRTLLRQQMEALGISVPGMLRNRWRIVDGPATSAARTIQNADAVSLKQRLKVVQGGATT